MRPETLSPELVRKAKRAARRRIREDRAGAREDVARLLGIIDERLWDPAFDVNELRRVESPSEETFGAFRDHLGGTPYAYLNRRRLEVARDLVCGSDALLAEIATVLGFNNQDAFSQWFKRGWRQSPRKTRSASRRTRQSRGTKTPNVTSAAAVYRALAGIAEPEEATELIRALSARSP